MNRGRATPVPIPNTEVKAPYVDDTWLATAWENRYTPDIYEELLRTSVGVLLLYHSSCVSLCFFVDILTDIWYFENAREIASF